MENRITSLFRKKSRNILSVFYTAGFPASNDTVEIGVALDKAGADIIEIGIPFSDPIADGPTIQQSNKVALDGGMTLQLLIEQVRSIRAQSQVPIILMGYLNPVLQYGMEAFVRDASGAGVDGVILPDMPLYEFEESFDSLFKAANLCNTFLISPTTREDRIRRIDALTNGFIYAVSASSTTGAKSDFSNDQIAYFEKLQSMKLKNPFLTGFGISNNATFAKACQYGAGAIVGSAFINMIGTSKDKTSDIVSFVGKLKGVNQEEFS